jgi:hypothetical protein
MCLSLASPPHLILARPAVRTTPSKKCQNQRPCLHGGLSTEWLPPGIDCLPMSRPRHSRVLRRRQKRLLRLGVKVAKMAAPRLKAAPTPGFIPHRQRRDCVAGVGGLELRNVVANYPCERSHRFAGIQSNSGFGDYSRLSCGVGDTQLGAGFCRDLQRAFCTEVDHHAASTRRHELAAISFVGIVFVAFDKATSDGQLGITILRHRSTDRIFSERHRCGRPVAAIPIVTPLKASPS